jgi:hypothetical protein
LPLVDCAKLSPAVKQTHITEAILIIPQLCETASAGA